MPRNRKPVITQAPWSSLWAIADLRPHCKVAIDYIAKITPAERIALNYELKYVFGPGAYRRFQQELARYRKSLIERRGEK